MVLYDRVYFQIHNKLKYVYKYIILYKYNYATLNDWSIWQLSNIELLKVSAQYHQNFGELLN